MTDILSKQTKQPEQELMITEHSLPPRYYSKYIKYTLAILFHIPSLLSRNYYHSWFTERKPVDKRSKGTESKS